MKYYKFLFTLFAPLIFLSVFIPSAVFATGTWTEQTESGSRSWQAVALSADGTKLAAVVYGGYIYTSTDSGATWTERTGSGVRSWYGITMSSDGTKLAASAPGNYIYTSTDSGATWTAQTNSGTRSFYSIAGSSDGSVLVAGDWSGYIYTSTDSGATWTAQTNSGTRGWARIAVSSDGSKIAAAAYSSSYIYTSTDYGVTWTERTGAGQRGWYGLDVSSDGTKMVAAATANYIYTSTDSGATWTAQTNAGSRNWRWVTMSADGSKLTAIGLGTNVYTSSNSGVDWVAQTSIGTRDWRGADMSSDGSKIATSVYNGYIYTYFEDTTPPAITSASSDKANGSYTVGEVIDIDITFSEAVTSTGNVTVTLETGDTDRTCTFTVSNSTTGTCNYTVQAGDTSSDLTVSSISGTIADQSANAMSNFVPATNLAANKALVIDTTSPTVSITAPTEGATVSGASVSITASASDTNLVGVQFKRDTNTNIGAEDTTSTYGVTWDTTALLDGAQSLIAVARDTAGNYATSTAVSVTVDNIADTPSGASGGGTNRHLTAICTVSDRTISVGEEISVDINIDTTEDSYEFEWTNVLEGDDEDTTYTFDTAGTFHPRGLVSAGRAGEAVANCGTITVIADDNDTENDTSDDDDDDSGSNNTNTTTVETTDASPHASLTEIVMTYKDFLLSLRALGIPLSAEVNAILDTLTTPTGTTTFTKDLEIGDNDPEVRLLQQFLNTNGYTIAPAGPGSPGNETTIFGYATRAALIRFQQANNITPAAGYFGSVTRGVVNSF